MNDERIERILRELQAQRDSRPNPLNANPPPEPEPRREGESLVDYHIRVRNHEAARRPNPLRRAFIIDSYPPRQED